MRSSAFRLHPHGVRMTGKRIHQGADLFESVGYLFGRELFVRKRELAHLRGVNDRMFEWCYGSAAWNGGADFPPLDGGTDGKFTNLCPRPDASFVIRDDQRRHGANQGTKKRSYFWGY